MPWAIGATPPGLDARSLQRVRNPISPYDTTVFATDFSSVLDSAIDGDTIASVIGIGVTRNDGGSDTFGSVIPPQLSPDARRVILWISGGVNGYEYLVSVRISSVAGQNLTRSFVLPVMMR